MSTITINGLAATVLGYQVSARTLISSRFLGTLNNPNHSRLLITTSVPGFSSCSTVLACDISSAIESDVVLGLDWAAHLRDSFLALGYCLGDTFNSWTFFSAFTPPCSYTADLSPLDDHLYSQNSHMLILNKNHVAPSGCQFKVVSFDPKDTAPSQPAQRDPCSSMTPDISPEVTPVSPVITPEITSEPIPSRQASKRPHDVSIPGPSNPKPPRTSRERRGIDALNSGQLNVPAAAPNVCKCRTWSIPQEVRDLKTCR